MFDRPSVCARQQLGSLWAEFHDIYILRFWNI